MFFSILISKIAALLLSAVGRGSSLPGKIALRLCPALLQRMRLPEMIVAVTGSNGKTSTTELILRLAESAGERVICNGEGSNQIEGIAALFIKHATLFGRVKAKIAVIESDERFCRHTFRYFTPQYIVVTNLFRDQLTRNGHNEFVFDTLLPGLPERSTLVLNADDPLSASFGVGRDRVIYFGIEPTAFTEEEKTHAYDDGGYCPICQKSMRYRYRIHNHLGAYRCTGCRFRRPEPLHSITAVSDGSFLIDGLYAIRPQMGNTMFANNVIAAFALASEAFGLSGEEIADCLDGYKLKNDRIRHFSLNGHRGIFMLTKHENSLSYNGVLETVVRMRSKEKTVVIIFDRLSRKYAANDISWLYDVDFSLLGDGRIHTIVLSGRFAYDLAVRLAFAGIPEEKMKIEPDIRAMTEWLREHAAGEIFAMTCFTDVSKFTALLKERGA